MCVETVTAVAWGPLSLATLEAFLQHRPGRFLLQLVVSMGEAWTSGFPAWEGVVG